MNLSWHPQLVSLIQELGLAVVKTLIYGGFGKEWGLSGSSEINICDCKHESCLVAF